MGKTLSVIHFINQVRGENTKVITNMKKYYALNKDFCIFNNNIYDIIDKFDKGIYGSDCIVFYDELFSCVKKGALPDEILTFISQMRKRGLYVLTTLQEWLDTNVTFRRYCRYYIDCSMFNIGWRAFAINLIHDGYRLKYDDIEKEYVAPVLKTTFRKCSKAEADSYDTYEVISVNSSKRLKREG